MAGSERVTATEPATPRVDPARQPDRRARGLPPLDITHERTAALDVFGVVVEPAEHDGDEPRTYLVVDRATGEAMLIDPAGDRARVLELVYDAQERAQDEGTPEPRVARIVITRRDERACATLGRVRRRLAAPVFAGAPDGGPVDAPLGASIDAVAPVGGELSLGASRVRVIPLHAGSPDGIGLIVSTPSATNGADQVFVGDAIGASGPPSLGRDRIAAMTLTMQLERGLLEGADDNAVVWRRRAGRAIVRELRGATTAWRRGYGLPATTADSPVWFTPAGSTLRVRRLHADPEHPDHRFVMFMIGSTVHGLIDPDDPFAFSPAFGVFPPIAAFLGLGPGDRSRSRRRAGDGAVRALHLGAGALVVPRMIHAALPGSTHVVVDIEPIVVDFVREHLTLPPGIALTVIGDDARAAIERFANEDASAFDVIVVDVFDRLTVPRSISSVEAFRVLRRVLAPSGTAIVNLPADPGSEAARVVVAAMLRVFPHVALAGPARVVDDLAAGNVIAAAAETAIDLDDVNRRLAADATPHVTLAGDDLRSWLGDSATRALHDA
ncbi:hypothetical protein GCM10011490_24880 [Pseudoclavibacter endophyticus]|uniref:Spermine synthase n=1 Tax=Pseudoclavibacter endophyticus TaxID=1778590 RepID=A0A6H9WJK0_9MICO|nr:fused MFS/spermidine synthase [Pseudoclavibacter endophyticus]KAB1647819.1 hypothetical protein F8O04_12425 [Pseudoclavibacter endophyticus]GGA73090.1 hypothetical protein GCM10011490_24880 [Pseudoclavibacter endophyticus]